MPTRLTRRAVLQGMSAGALVPALRYFPRSEGASFAFFSDTHVGLKNNIDADRAMLAEIAALRPAFAINGGDVTDYGWVGEYRNYRSLIDPLPFKVHHIPGNHDVRWSPLGPKAYREGTGSPMYSSFDHGQVHFALLDSTVPLSHWGHFESEQLRWLAADLKKTGRDRPVILVTHHWVGRDGVMVDNEVELLKVIEPYNVKLILNGHGHRDLLWTWNGIANTMNRGLYQGSYEIVTVSTTEIRLARRSTEHTAPVEILSMPIRRAERHSYWQVPASLAGGEAVNFAGSDAETPKEARWGDGKWMPVVGGVVPTVGLIAGTARLSLRSDETTYFDAGETRVEGSSGVLRKAWERKLSGGVMSHLRLDDGVLFVSAMDGSLTAMRAEDGHVLWTAKTLGYCHSSPCVTDTLVVVGSADDGVYAFERKSGARRWRYGTDGPVYASAASIKGLAVIASGDGSVVGLNLRDGRRVWRYDLPKSETAFVQSPIAADGERVYLGAWDKYLYCLEAATGKFLWRRDCVGEKSFAYSPSIGGPCLGDGKVYVPSDGNQLWAFDAVTGEQAWSVSSPGDKFGYSSPSFVDGKVYVGCLGDRGEVRCVDAHDGTILWTAETGAVIYDSGPVVTNGVVLVGSVASRLNAISASDGRVIGQYGMPTGHFLSTAAVSGGRVYAATYSDRCVAFDLM